MTKKNDHRNQVYVASLKDSAVKDAINSEKSMLVFLAHAIKMAASDVGRFDPLNQALKEVPTGMLESIRFWFVNLATATGISATAENGRERKVTFFRFTTQKGYHFPDNRTDAMKDHRAIIDGMSIEDLMKIPLGPVSRKDTTERMEKGLEDFEAAISRTLKTYFNSGVLTQALVERFNGLLSETARIDPASIVADRNKRIESAKKFLANAGALPTNDNVVELPEPVSRTGTN